MSLSFMVWNVSFLSLLLITVARAAYYDYTCNKGIHISDTDPTQYIWQAPLARYCSWELTFDTVPSYRIIVLQVSRENGSSATSLRYCRVSLNSNCLTSTKCATLLFTTSSLSNLQSAYAPLYSWDWMRTSSSAKLNVSRNLAFIYCGDNTVKVSVRIATVITTTAKPPVTTRTTAAPTRPPPPSKEGMSVDTMIVLQLLIPGLIVFVVVAFAVYLFACFRRRQATRGELGHINVAYQGEPPSYDEHHKYPMTEQYQMQIAQRDMKWPLEEKSTIFSISSAQHGNYMPTGRPESPPPDYAHTRRIKSDIDGESLYEAVMGVDEVACSSSSSSSSPSSVVTVSFVSTAPSIAISTSGTYST